MKLAISAIGYECAEHLNEVLAPWEELKKHHKVRISAAHGIFPETHKLGFSVESRDDSHNIIPAHPSIDNFVFLEEPTYEKDIRNATLPFLFEEEFDLLLLLDLQDEIYEVNQILKAFKFVNHPLNKELDWFKINFKNYIFEDNCWIDDFIVPRIWKSKRSDGVSIKNFHYDNDIIYTDDIQAQSRPHTIIPSRLTFPKHLSWVGSKDYLIRKIEFQKIHYGDCSYSWSEEENRLTFNEEYYKKFNKFKPELNYE